MKLQIFLLLVVYVYMNPGTQNLTPGTGSDDSRAKGLLLVANKVDQSLSIIDVVSGQQVGVVPEGGITGHEVAASPDGRFAYVPIYGNSGVGRSGTDGRRVVVIDIKERKVTGEVDFGRGVRPHCAMFGPRSGLLYITTELDNAVTLVDPSTLKIVGSIPTDRAESHMLTMTRDERRGYVTNVGSGSVSVLDLQSRKTLAVIPVAPSIQRITLSVDEKLAFTSDQTKPDLIVIDTATNKVTEKIVLPGIGYGSAATQNGRWLVIALAKANKVAIIDLNSMKIAQTVDVPSAPQYVLLRPDNKFAYISCDQSGQIVVLNLETWKVERLIAAGKGADGLAWAPTR